MAAGGKRRSVWWTMNSPGSRLMGGVEPAMALLRRLPFEDLGHTKIDHHRELRRGAPEAIYCAGKTSEQVAEIVESMAANSERLMGTRASVEQFEAAQARVADLQYDA